MTLLDLLVRHRVGRDAARLVHQLGIARSAIDDALGRELTALARTPRAH